MIDRLRLVVCLVPLVMPIAPALAEAQGPARRAKEDDSPSAERFRKPDREAGVHVWWHWMDGAITREGITKDLETMKDQGVVQATILNVGLFGGRDLGVPRVRFASDEWFAMFRWALSEAHRLGIRIGVHNCDGWSSSGGPWITPEQSMKQLVWTKTVVPGGAAAELALPRPAALEGFYRDVAVVAYRTEQQPSAFSRARPKFQANGVEDDVGKLVDGCPVSGRRLQKGDRFVLSASSPLAFDRVAVHVRRPFMWGDPEAFTTRFAVETSTDGRDYSPLSEVTALGLNRTHLVDVPATSAPFVRVSVQDVSQTDPWIPVELGELELLRRGESPAYAPAIPFIGEKTSGVKGRDDAVHAPLDDAAPAVATADIVVLTDRMDTAGRLRWTPPEGTWAVLRFGTTSTGARNGPATAEGTGLEADKMDSAAIEHHFRSFPARLIEHAGEHTGETLRFVLVDSWEAGFQNWTAALPAEFERRRGYSLVPWLPALTGVPISSPAESEAVLFDFRQTIADLIRESYYERLAALLHERRVELHAEVIYGGGAYPPLDVLRSTKPVDLPMFEFWTSADKDNLLVYDSSRSSANDPGSLAFNLPAAAVAGYGKRLLGSEAYTGYAHYSESPADLKPFGDRAFAAGINRMILHSSVHQPKDEKPGLTLGPFASHFNRNNLYWNHSSAWLLYQARVQSVLGEGDLVSDVLYFLGDQLPQSYVRNASTLLPFGYSLQAVNAELLQERASVVDGRLRLNGTGDAALLSLPPQPRLSLETLRRVEALVRAGAQVYGPKPLAPLSLADLRASSEFRQIADRVWGDVDGTRVFRHAYGAGAVTWGRPIADVLAERGEGPRFSAGPESEQDFLFTHRRVGEADVFFVASQRNRELSRELSFRVGGKTPEVWDAETGEVKPPSAFRADKGRVILPARFTPYQALLFVFRPGPSGRRPAVMPSAPETLQISGLAGTLHLRGPGAPSQPIEVTRLRSLTEDDDPAVRYFSGEATYRLRFSVSGLPAAATDELRLELGDFESVAEVTLNGRSLGQAWRPGQSFDVTGLLRVDNDLVVTVANVYRNRLIGDLAQYGEVRNLRTSSPIADFLSADKPLKKAGLIGPIRVTHAPRPRPCEARPTAVGAAGEP